MKKKKIALSFKLLALIVGLLLTAYSLPLYAQFPDTVAVTIDTAQVNSSAVDLNGKKLFAVGFPTTAASDTFFVQTRKTTTGAWQDAYYTSATGTKVRLIVLFQASSVVAIHRDMAFFLLRYVRLVGDDKETCRLATPLKLNVYRGNY